MPLQKEETENKNCFIASYVGLLPIKPGISDIGNDIDRRKKNDFLDF
jgi:hypothetical protein